MSPEILSKVLEWIMLQFRGLKIFHLVSDGGAKNFVAHWVNKYVLGIFVDFEGTFDDLS